MEVSNNSKTDPAAWVARVVGITKKAVTVEYPFHDTPGETHKVLDLFPADQTFPHCSCACFCTCMLYTATEALTGEPVQTWASIVLPPR